MPAVAAADADANALQNANAKIAHVLQTAIADAKNKNQKSPLSGFFGFEKIFYRINLSAI